MKPLRLAVDTNLLLDWADGVDAVLDALELVGKRLDGAEKLIPPSVLDELAFLCDQADTTRVQRSARNAMTKLRQTRQFKPLLELPHPDGHIEAVAGDIRARGLLPEAEVHDSMILAEAALLDCEILLTSDAHLRGVDHQMLTLVLNQFDLSAPVIATPREIVRKFFPQ